MDKKLLVVIDAQRAFVDPAGSLACAFGMQEIQPSTSALERLRVCLSEPGSHPSTVFVRSEYRPGQFTDGRLDDPLAALCVPGRNIDCEWATGLDTSRAAAVITKHHPDAASSGEYRDLLERAVASGVEQIFLAGFQFTTCVKASALTTVGLFGGRGVRVAVLESLSGARASSYEATVTGASRVEEATRELRASGVTVLEGFDRAV
jgi:nicotinamidase-related amidase